MANMQKISTCLWYDTGALEAAELYVSLLPNSRVTQVTRYGPGAPMPEGTPMLVAFTLAGVDFAALNGGPMFKHSEAVSLFVLCDDQAEIDRLWSALTANGGAESMCGWLKDRWGVSWQIQPARVAEWIKDPIGHSRALRAMMGMRKIDAAVCEAAFAGQ